MQRGSSVRCPTCKNASRFIAESRYQTKFQCLSCRRIFLQDRPFSETGVRFKCLNHQGKASAFVNALKTKYEHVEDLDTVGVRFILSDSDVMGRAGQLKRMAQKGVKRFFVYPHSARPSMINDMYPTWAGTTAQFVVNEYHAEVLRGYGYKKPLESVGWYMSDIGEFQSRESVRNVLFAPIHPRNAPVDKKVNQMTLERLYKLVQRDEISLTVRHIGHLADNGIEELAGVRYVKGGMDGTTADMDRADVVIGHQTFAWLAVAKGKPCVMMAEDMPTHFRRVNTTYDNTPSWDKVAHLFQYPLDILAEDDTLALLNRAARSDCEIADWKRRMIGDPFSYEKFVAIVEKYL